MSDFKIQHGSVTILTAGTSVSITAGVDYVAPASLSNAFIRIVGVLNVGSGVQDSDFNGMPARSTVVIDNPSNLLTSIDFVRYQSTGAVTVAYEIIEYIGEPSGKNEFIVHQAENISVGTDLLTADGSNVPGIADHNDVAVLQTGVRTARNSRGNIGAGAFTTEWISSSNVARVTKGIAGNQPNDAFVSVAVVEFTGPSWLVQRVEHAFTGTTTETETISTVGDISNAFSHYQTRTGVDDTGPDGIGFEAWLTSDTELSLLSSNHVTGKTVVAWIISNPDMNVEHISGSRADNASSNNPDTWTETVASTGDISGGSIMGESSNSDNVADSHLVMIGFELTSPTEVTLTRGRDEAARDYRFDVVTWPRPYSPKGRWLFAEASDNTQFPSVVSDDTGNGNSLLIDYSAGDAEYTSTPAGSGLDFTAPVNTVGSAVARLEDLSTNGTIGTDLKIKQEYLLGA